MWCPFSWGVGSILVWHHMTPTKMVFFIFNRRNIMKIAWFQECGGWWNMIHPEKTCLFRGLSTNRIFLADFLYKSHMHLWTCHVLTYADMQNQQQACVRCVRLCICNCLHFFLWFAILLGIQSPSENGIGTNILCWGGDWTHQSCSDNMTGCLGIWMIF